MRDHLDNWLTREDGVPAFNRAPSDEPDATPRRRRFIDALLIAVLAGGWYFVGVLLLLVVSPGGAAFIILTVGPAATIWVGLVLVVVDGRPRSWRTVLGGGLLVASVALKPLTHIGAFLGTQVLTLLGSVVLAVYLVRGRGDRRIHTRAPSESR